MALLVPAINAYTEGEFVERARLLRSCGARTVQLDVSDGIFGTPKNFASPEIAARELAGVRLDVHLMVREVPTALTAWRMVAPVRITVHVEVLRDPQVTLTAIQSAGSERGLALGPGTPVERVLPHLADVELLLFVAVPPGRSGQSFDPTTFERIRLVRERFPRLAIGVDGGITAALIPGLRAAGTTTIVVASAMFSAPDPRAAYEELKRSAES